MSLTANHNGAEFSVGDVVKVTQRIKEGDKSRSYVFEGVVISIKGRDINRSFTVRRIGAAQIGIERIFPLSSPIIEKISIVKEGGKGVSHAKLYNIRGKSKRDVEKIYTRHNARSQKPKTVKKTVTAKKKSSK